MKLLSNPYVLGAVGVGVLLLIVALILFFRNLERGEVREEENLQNQGAVIERLQTQEETLNAVRNAQRPVTDDELERVRDKYDRNRPVSP